MPSTDITLYFRETFHPSLVTVIQNIHDKELFFKSFANFIKLTKSLPKNPVKIDDIPFLYTQFTNDFAHQIAYPYSQRLTQQKYLALILCLNEQCLVGQINDLSLVLKHIYKHSMGIKTLNVLLILSKLTNLYVYLSNNEGSHSSLSPTPAKLDLHASPLNIVAFYNYACDDTVLYRPSHNLLLAYDIFKACLQNKVPLTNTVLDRLIHTPHLEQTLEHALPHYLGLTYLSNKISGQYTYEVSYNDSNPIQNNVNHQVAAILIKHIDIVSQHIPFRAPINAKKLYQAEHNKTLITKINALHEPKVQQTLNFMIKHIKNRTSSIASEDYQVLEYMIYKASSIEVPPCSSTQQELLHTWMKCLNETEKEMLIEIGHPLIPLKTMALENFFKPTTDQTSPNALSIQAA